MTAGLKVGARSTFAIGNGFGMPTTMYRKDSGALALERVAVFRSGTFRDSSGMQNTWEGLHMRQMIDNWNHLRDGKIFDDVPVRDGHPGWLIHGLPGNGSVVGWHTNLATEKATAPHDDEEYHYIFADYEITDPNAATNIENGTWRNRSAEIGTYVTNDEAEFWPVYMGFAYVDIPAVEGLKFQSPVGTKLFVINFTATKETGVTVPITPALAAAPIPVAALPTQPATPAAPVLPFAAPAATTQTYVINGSQVADPIAVQNHILSLEQFQRDTVEANRRNFVTGLAGGAQPKIAATQIDGLTEFAQKLTPEMYAAWTATFATAPVSSTLTQHGQTVSNPGNAAQDGQVDRVADEISVWEATVLQHRRAGTPTEAIKNTNSYKKLVAAGKTVDL